MVFPENTALLALSPRRPDPVVFTLIRPTVANASPTLSNVLVLMLGTRVALCWTPISRSLMPFDGALVNFVFETLKKHFAVEPASSPQPRTMPLGKRPVYLLSNVSAVLLSVVLRVTCELPLIE